MTRYKLLAAAALLSAVTATPVLAQPVIDEPGNFAFFHPNGDLGLGSARPADAMASGAPHNSGNMARLRNATMSHPLAVRRGPSTKAY